MKQDAESGTGDQQLWQTRPATASEAGSATSPNDISNYPSLNKQSAPTATGTGVTGTHVAQDLSSNSSPSSTITNQPCDQPLPPGPATTCSRFQQ